MSTHLDLMRRVEGGYFPDGEHSVLAKRVLLTLAYFADQDGTNSFPSRNLISAYTGLSISSVKRGLAKLRAEEIIIKHESPRAQSIPVDQRPNQYRLAVQKLRTLRPREVREIMETRVLTDPEGGSHRPPTQSITNPENPVVESSTEVQAARAENPATTTITDDHRRDEEGTIPAHHGSAPTKMKSGWRPNDRAMDTAREIAKFTDLEIHITKYRVWCHRKKRTPDSGEWLSWLTRDEDEARKEELRSAQAARKKQWWDVAD